MSEPREDRRIMRTRQLITEAFLHILLKKPYADISVVDIAERANINRSTFYAHFLDKEDLLDKLVGEKLGGLRQALDYCAAASEWRPAFNEADPIFVHLFDHAFEHNAFYQIMSVSHPVGHFSSMLTDIIKDSFLARISRHGLDQKVQVPLDLLLDHIGCSTTGILVKWLADNSIYSPRHMALQLTRVAWLGVYAAMGAAETKPHST
ncbi:TetR/AcrR family transcriptional regulator [Paenibacillus sp. SYP-B4298]|uniref:TetR/AcrR family transcriptional regulator n=1 Tax=Paenibacillus sp. SYP-B4298 TaxID=2996034 RepID=UPI0022DE068B|nr:TetR/AcrR family transcriptional regulator [Paenibacillus sp. SYP-B4298]